MRTKRWIAGLLAVALLAGACGDDDSAGGGGGGPGEMAMAASDEERTQPDLEADDPTIDSLVDGDTEFALDLYRELVDDDPDANLFLSPYSITVALAMTLPGTRGDTFDQLATALRADDGEEWHQARNGLDRLLLDRSTQGDEAEVDLRIANSLFGQEGYPFEGEFLDLLARNYGAGMRLLDFMGSPDESRQTINRWVEDETDGLIDELLADGTISPDTRLVLANAIYFRAVWANQFPESRTEPADFTTRTGDTVSVDMMRANYSTRVGEGDGWAAARLPYEGGASMLVILPDQGSFDEFVGSFEAARLNEIRSELGRGDLRLRMPRFELDTSLSLVETLERVGVIDLFLAPSPTEGADLTGMTESRDLFVSDVIHQAVVSVDEEGTEAAAATAVIVDDLSSPPPERELELTLDRPFIFLIQDDATGAILFIGHVNDPGGAGT